MIAVDTNILVFAHRADAPAHAAAISALQTIAESPSSWAIPWPCVHEFISVVTHPHIYRPASTLAQAFAFTDSLMSSPSLQLLAETPGYLDKLRQIAGAGRIVGARIHDARIAALCAHHGVSELWTADRDFSMFPQLKIRNPLVQV